MTALSILKELDPSNKIPQKIAGDDGAQNRAAVTAGGDDFVEMFDLQAVVKGVANAMGGVEERKRAENEEVEPHEGKRKKGRGGGVLGGFGEAEGGGDSEDEEVNGDQKSGDDTAGAEEEPQERLDAEFGWLSVHFVFCPFVRWNPSSSVDFLVGMQPASKKQIPHPAKSAGIRDDSGVEILEVNKAK
jgi:hypothetical protein